LQTLKGLSPGLRLAIGGMDVYICIWRGTARVFIIFYFLDRSLIQIKVLPMLLPKQVDSQIRSGDRMQTLSIVYPLPGGIVSKGYSLPSC
jgi:hypothetical protein